MATARFNALVAEGKTACEIRATLKEGGVKKSMVSMLMKQMQAPAEDQPMNWTLSFKSKLAAGMSLNDIKAALQADGIKKAMLSMLCKKIGRPCPDGQEQQPSGEDAQAEVAQPSSEAVQPMRRPAAVIRRKTKERKVPARKVKRVNMVSGDYGAAGILECALVIKERWAKLILGGEKVVEVRSYGYKSRLGEPVGLVISKTQKVFGQVVVHSSEKLTPGQLRSAEWASKHCCDASTVEEFIAKHDSIFAWHLESVMEYPAALPFDYPQGAVNFIPLQDNSAYLHAIEERVPYKCHECGKHWDAEEYCKQDTVCTCGHLISRGE